MMCDQEAKAVLLVALESVLRATVDESMTKVAPPEHRAAAERAAGKVRRLLEAVQRGEAIYFAKEGAA